MNEDFYLESYNKLKDELGRKPKINEFYGLDGVTKNSFTKTFGNNPYSKLQELAGDEANKLVLVRTPRKEILSQFGDVTEKLGKLPTQSDWSYFDCKPTVSGIERPPHNIKWKDLPFVFLEWAKQSNQYPRAQSLVKGKARIIKKQKDKDVDKSFENLKKAIKEYSKTKEI